MLQAFCSWIRVAIYTKYVPSGLADFKTLQATFISERFWIIHDGFGKWISKHKAEYHDGQQFHPDTRKKTRRCAQLL
jgi:hypothetical protein